MKKLFKIEWRLDDMSPQDILLALRKYNPIWQVLNVIEQVEHSNRDAICLESGQSIKPNEEETKYPCTKCGKLRTKAEGGTTFTVCDRCWDKMYRGVK